MCWRFRFVGTENCRIRFHLKLRGQSGHGPSDRVRKVQCATLVLASIFRVTVRPKKVLVLEQGQRSNLVGKGVLSMHQVLLRFRVARRRAVSSSVFRIVAVPPHLRVPFRRLSAFGAAPSPCSAVRAPHAVCCVRSASSVIYSRLAELRKTYKFTRYSATVRVIFRGMT